MSDNEPTPYVKPDLALFGDEHIRRYEARSATCGTVRHASCSPQPAARVVSLARAR